ncbi:MAG: mannose-6-phosphate isomerase [Tenericutes bacterium GWC2_34_14]|nr:MAG: mannose-6-phosphate isomerase [Tenericutes bacterium GWC2_34_14]OHE34533.1 MAG: mannose-6-phosphate isomerase [Tenericutes bacterium GWE2_34_108]OHE35890.1 MAG: mannose-6-phosphate isomerase [Tenericutes bacterium GWF1_35_14]OHE39024.1 MAG: mannose-6-phosphate isomerase [Tenericutes bacterium GWF2_35_184]OHE42909.1 MAG: mannose-6-phosphate isomerase [Tenericutes bacterium RIFOXYA2_FULL_36_32]OHE46137.1 MAG: mannose-6-phosphate isomerase [Tenericutes bacterium RIFOXYB2_FULL_36_25]OHE47
MKYLNFKSEYNRKPVIPVSQDRLGVFDGSLDIINELKSVKEGLIVFETYPGIDLNRLKSDVIDHLKPSLVVHMEDFSKSEQDIDSMIERNLTDDRVFGLFSHHKIEDFYHAERLKSVESMVLNTEGLVVVYGFGASLIEGGVRVHVSLTRWEIQLRYRKGLSNFKKNNPKEDILRKYKRGYFVEWRVADRIKDAFYKDAHYVIDYNMLDHPKMMMMNTYQNMLDTMIRRPFRMVPYFDPGVWGGQWMKEVMHLDPKEKNYAWSFDGVPEENSIMVSFGDVLIELPAQDLVQFRPRLFMGDRVHGRFGKNFPIRFDFLDTMGGGNLSLQVHPLTEYIQDQFGMTYTQDESYYIMDTEDDGVVYLGFKEGVEPKAVENDLRKAEAGGFRFPAEKYVNVIPAKKHDHFLIPAGTIHCSGKNTVVLEISACNYIFTFKLWDWDRVGLDGRPRPVHLDHGFKNLQYDRDTKFVHHELYNAITRLSDVEEKTGLHEREFLETRRFTFKDYVDIPSYGSVNMANLVEGKKAVIESVDHSFEPYEIHYAETFIIPATIDTYRVRCLDESCIIVKAHVR